MRSHSASLAIALALVGAVAASADTSVDVGVANGDSVSGSLSPEGEREVVRVRVPRGALLSVVAKGRKTKGSTTPAITFRVLNGDDVDVAAGSLAPKGAVGSALKKLEILESGAFRVEVRSTDASGGDYRLKVKWKSPKKLTRVVELGDDEVAIEFAADAGAIASMIVTSSRGSLALPRLLRVERAGGAVVLDARQPDDGAKKHKVKGIVLVDGGDYRAILVNAGAGGAVKFALKLKAPKPSRRAISVTDSQVGGGKEGGRALGEVIGRAGGDVTLPLADAFGLGGAALLVPPGAVAQPTALLVGSAPPLNAPPEPDLRSVGPTVFFGPEGQKFEVPVRVTIPFDVSAFRSDFATLVIVERDARGRTRVVPRPYSVDVETGTVSFAVSHFTAYRAFGPLLPPVRSDLNADGFSDYVYVDASDAVRRVRVVLGGPTLVSRAIDAGDIVFQGTATNDVFGDALATGDVNGDGVEDLIIGARNAASSMGRVFVFFGGADFVGSGDAEADADVVLRGVAGRSRVGLSLAVGQLVGDDALDLVVGTDSGTFNDLPSALVYEGGAALVTDAVPVVRITGQVQTDFAAHLSVADVTGDGRDDLLIGSGSASVNGTFGSPDRRGKVHVFLGGAGFASGAETDADVTLAGAADFDQFGANFTVGDVLGDGTSDIVVSTADPGSTTERIFVFAGGPGLADATSATADVRITGGGVATDFFGTALSIANVGGDAKGDILIGDRFLFGNAERPGGVAIFYGGSGLLSGPVGDADVLLLGRMNADFFGETIAVLDLTGDGALDLVVTGGGDDTEGQDSGAAFVFAGGSALPVTANAADIVLRGLSFTQ